MLNDEFRSPNDAAKRQVMTGTGALGRRRRRGERDGIAREDSGASRGTADRRGHHRPHRRIWEIAATQGARPRGGRSQPLALPHVEGRRHDGVSLLRLEERIAARFRAKRGLGRSHRECLCGSAHPLAASSQHVSCVSHLWLRRFHHGPRDRADVDAARRSTDENDRDVPARAHPAFRRWALRRGPISSHSICCATAQTISISTCASARRADVSRRPTPSRDCRKWPSRTTSGVRCAESS